MTNEDVYRNKRFFSRMFDVFTNEDSSQFDDNEYSP